METKIIVPEGMFPNENILEDLISAYMRLIGKQCGGDVKYGANYENDVFKMHPFCWCEEDDCVYCTYPDEEEGTKTAPNFIHKASGLSVWWYKYIGRGMEFEGMQNDIETLDIFKECLESIKLVNLEAV